MHFVGVLSMPSCLLLLGLVVLSWCLRVVRSLLLRSSSDTRWSTASAYSEDPVATRKIFAYFRPRLRSLGPQLVRMGYSAPRCVGGEACLAIAVFSRAEVEIKLSGVVIAAALMWYIKLYHINNALLPLLGYHSRLTYFSHVHL